MDTEEKRALEAEVMEKMIVIYCHGKKHIVDGGDPPLCPRCRRLLAYARGRVENCPRMAVKSFCSACPVHCYTPDMRAEIRAVMRYSGPRMLLHHPVMTLHHMWIDCRARQREKKGVHL